MLEDGQVLGFSIFSNLSKKQRVEIAAMGQVMDFNPMEVIFYQGERARYLFGIIEGAVNLSLAYEEKLVRFDVKHEDYVRHETEILKKSIVVDSLGPGDIFAWSALVGPGFFTATARCSESTRLVALPPEDLRTLMKNQPDIGYAAMTGLAEIISHRRQKITDKLIEVWGEYYDQETIEA